ncbi:hypothetical protein FS935_16680 [Metabacillus litoralis]|uniref:Uncharacterized protein n=1 Tax=Metabacillus litoralis TaxID=152268 RepID=A0A5C6VZQ3_9BACI|nr:hypothetical protein [Metabacillus litoralis]TXC89516.1 hypothetical protein FS935_16680 [Metabacillus litoralis]
MNDNQFTNKLGNDFMIIKEDGIEIIDVYPKNIDGSANLDVGFKLVEQRFNQSWLLREVQREKEYELGKFSSREIGVLALYAAVKGRFDNLKVNKDVKKKLREKADTLIIGDEILKGTIDSKYFSLGLEKEGALNLEEESKKYNIYYLTFMKEKVIISKGRSLSSALVVLYNYGLLLEKFENQINPLLKQSSIHLAEREVLKKLYIGK